MYAKNEQFKWGQLKGQMDEVEKRRKELDLYFETVRFNQQLRVSEIPLPPPIISNSVGTISEASFTSEMPLSEYYEPITPSPQYLLYHGPWSETRQQPGAPPGLPQNGLQDANILKTMCKRKRR